MLEEMTMGILRRSSKVPPIKNRIATLKLIHNLFFVFLFLFGVFPFIRRRITVKGSPGNTDEGRLNFNVLG